MTLTVTNDKIIIKNANGVEKFNSSQRLVYRTGFATGSVFISALEYSKIISHNLNYDSTKQFYNIFVKITACSGNAVSNILNLRLPANNQILINQSGTNNGARVYTYPSLLSTSVSTNQIIFTYMNFNANGTPYIQPGGFDLSMSYELYIYNYTT